MMGIDGGQKDCGPAHRVTLSSYYIGETEVTQALWKAVTESNPAHFKGDNLPVESVTLAECYLFIEKLNQLIGRTFRLPTEVEWEYAARGSRMSRGTHYAGSDELSEKFSRTSTKASSHQNISPFQSIFRKSRT